jgi:hypothetical protein
MKPGTTSDCAKTQASGPSSAPCPSPHNSARSAVETACRSQRRDAEDAETAELLTHAPRPHDERWDDARGLFKMGLLSSARPAVEIRDSQDEVREARSPTCPQGSR